MTIGVLASGKLGFIILKQIYFKYNIKFVLSDNKSSDIHNFCSKNKIPNFNGNPRTKNAYYFIKNIKVKIIVSINYLFIINNDIINHADLMSINVHGSLLPKYRGRTPHVWAIINGEKEAGITIHKIEEGCDTGPIIKQKKILIEPNDTGFDLLTKYENEYFNLIVDVITKISKKKYTLMYQKEEDASYFGKRTPADGKIDWNWTKERIRNWVRAQSYPYPGAFTYYKKNKIIIDKVISIEEFNLLNMPNGTVIKKHDEIIIKCDNGGLLLKKIRNKKDFIIQTGEVLN